MTREKLFKAYYIAHSLLSDFQNRGGYHSLVAEEDMFNCALDFVKFPDTKKAFTKIIEFEFGLSVRNINKAVKEYNEWRKSLE